MTNESLLRKLCVAEEKHLGHRILIALFLSVVQARQNNQSPVFRAHRPQHLAECMRVAFPCAHSDLALLMTAISKAYFDLTYILDNGALTAHPQYVAAWSKQHLFHPAFVQDALVRFYRCLKLVTAEKERRLMIDKPDWSFLMIDVDRRLARWTELVHNAYPTGEVITKWSPQALYETTSTCVLAKHHETTMLVYPH